MKEPTPKGIMYEVETSKWCPYCLSEQMVCVEAKTVPHWRLPKPIHATELTWRCPTCAEGDE